MNRKKFLKLFFYILFVCTFLCSCKDEELFETAQNSFAEQNWQQAFDAANKIVEDYPKSKKRDEAESLMIESKSQLDSIDVLNSFAAKEYTDAIMQAYDVISTTKNEELFKQNEDIILRSMQILYDQGNYTDVIEYTNKLSQEYPNIEVDDKIIELQQYAQEAASFQPVQIKDYSSYQGLLDFGAFCGVSAIEDSDGVFRYKNVSQGIVDRYIHELQLKGFTRILGSKYIMTNKTYSILLTHNGNTLRIAIDYITNLGAYNMVEVGMDYNQVVKILNSPGRLVKIYEPFTGFLGEIVGDTAKTMVYQWVTYYPEKARVQIDISKNIVTGMSKYSDKKSQNNTQSKNRDPMIGMSDEEVLDSTWGSPKKKNKTTTAYGTWEQWVYDNSRYIYLDNGIVTAIQESE